MDTTIPVRSRPPAQWTNSGPGLSAIAVNTRASFSG